MKKNVIFGAGNLGERAYYYCKRDGIDIECFVDNDEKKRQFLFCGCPVVNIEQLKKNWEKWHVIVACWGKVRKEVIRQLEEEGCFDYHVFNEDKVFHRERLLTNCKKDLQDVILYHVLKKYNDIFYIDVGANDPLKGSVTKLLYDKKNAKGINIEPVEWYFNLLCMERERDINLC